MKTIYIANDQTCFRSKRACRKYEQKFVKTVRIPLVLLQECHRQCTPYMVLAKERRELAAKLEPYLSK